MRIDWFSVARFSQIDVPVTDSNGQVFNGLDYFEKTIRESMRGRTSIPREYYALWAVDCRVNRLFPTILPFDLLLMAYLFITFQWGKASTLRKAYRVFRVVNCLRLAKSDLSSAIYYFQSCINKLSKEEKEETV